MGKVPSLPLVPQGSLNASRCCCEELCYYLKAGSSSGLCSLVLEQLEHLGLILRRLISSLQRDPCCYYHTADALLGEQTLAVSSQQQEQGAAVPRGICGRCSTAIDLFPAVTHGEQRTSHIYPIYHNLLSKDCVSVTLADMLKGPAIIMVLTALSSGQACRQAASLPHPDTACA